MLVRDFKQDKPLTLKQTNRCHAFHFIFITVNQTQTELKLQYLQIYYFDGIGLVQSENFTWIQSTILKHRRWTDENCMCVCDKERDGASEKCTSIFKIKFYAFKQFAKQIFMSQLLWDSFICLYGDEHFHSI